MPLCGTDDPRGFRARALAAEAALEGLHNARATVVVGYAARALPAEQTTMGADLISVGSHGHSRVAGVLLGSVATRMVHSAPCSVLVARDQPRTPGFPRSIVVGIDTSPASVEAAAIAEAIGASTGVCIRCLTATGGKRLPADAALRAELDTRSPVDALVDAGRSSDLLVVGSRGLHGLSALGSVAARVAHQASCPVLIMRADSERRFELQRRATHEHQRLR